MHIKIRYGRPGEAAVVIDGMDITSAVLAEDFGIEFPETPGTPAIVRARLRADLLEVDLPDAVLSAEPVEDEQ